MTMTKDFIDPRNMTILAVDDMKSMRLTMRKMLKHLNIGKILKFAENGREGLTVLQSSPADLVIIDWQMPLMNGTQMLESIRNDKALRDIPVIMVSAESEKDIVLEVAETEIDGYLLKPLTLDALDKKIKTVVDRVNNPDKASLLINEARDFEESGDLESAIEKIKHALTFRPSASRLLRRLGLLYAKTGKSEIAEKCLRKAASVNPQDANTRQIMGEMYIKKNDLEKAARYYLEVLSLTTRFSEEAILLGEKLMAGGRKNTAVKLFSKIIASVKKNLAIKERIVDICLACDEFEYAKELLDSLIREFPSKYDLVFKTGMVYVTTGDLEKALELFLTVDRYQTGRMDVKLEIAKIYYHHNKLYQADEYLNRILKKDPGNEDALILRRAI